MSSEHAAQALPTATTNSLHPILHSARDELTAKTVLARAGLDSLARYSEHLDDIVRRIYLSARDCTDTPVVLVALGGYGRKQLCLHSDIDLLLLFAEPIGSAEEQFLKSMLHPLWDLRLDVGHHLREIADLEQPDINNPEFLVSLLEARYLDGDTALFEQLTRICNSSKAPWRDPILKALLNLIEQRHAQFNRTLYQLEPDVKNAPGALRDVSAIRMIGQLLDLHRHPNLDIGKVSEAEDFLLRIRSILHLDRRRNLNVLSHELQETAAKLFGSPGEQLARQVETLMSTYFHHARIINRALKSSLKALATEPDVPAVPLADGLERRGNEISFADGTRASLRPRTWLQPFEAALETKCVASEQMLTCIERHGERYSPEQFFPTTEQRDLLLRVLRPRPGLYARLSEMHDRGLLGRMFPEFQRIYCLVIRDFYHKYTVDEHTLLTIHNLESLCNPKNQSRRRFAGLLAEVAAPELLVLALLFHDVGKWTNKNHSEEGVRMALGALRRIRLPERDISTVEFLIRHHLKMSTAAFRRDTEDPAVVTQFAKLVGTEERLKLLCLLTLADVGAVGPDVMTPWKEELLWRLYVDTYNRLTLEYGDDIIDTTTISLAELQKTRPDDISQEDLMAFLEGYPQRYLRVVDQSRIYEHVRLSRNLQPAEVHSALIKTDAAWELSTIAVDQPGLFANVCGVLSYFGMNILRGQAMTNDHGIVLDIFQFGDQEGYLRLNQTAESQITKLLGDVVAGRTDIESRLQGRQHAKEIKRQLKRVTPVIRFNDHYSRRFTVLEIVAENAWGLLYHISRTISSQTCDIELVLISTEGAQAIDVFHLTQNGEKLSDSVQHSLAKALESILKLTT